VALESILGFHLRGDRLRVRPCIPADWPGYEITYRRGRSTYHIRVENPRHVAGGVAEVTSDGRPVPDGEVVLVDDGGEHEVRVVI
jgi:cyclic beta-1,2-glucan synthetase